VAVVTETTRRGFLGTLSKVLGVAAAAELGVVTVAYLWPRKGAPGAASQGIVDAGPVAEFTPSSVTAFPGGRFYLVRLQDGGFLALSSTCTHLQCTVPWSEKDRKFPCPCHGSAFDMTGQVLSPPAPRALDLFPVTIDGGVVRVDTRKKVRRERFEPSQVTYL
jgi:cytochrome b6-f complex iron-sulfur subunit